MITDREGLMEGVENSLGDESRLFEGCVAADEHELVASEPGEGVLFTGRRCESARNVDQQSIAYVVTQRVVDQFEAVEIDE